MPNDLVAEFVCDLDPRGQGQTACAKHEGAREVASNAATSLARALHEGMQGEDVPNDLVAEFGRDIDPRGAGSDRMCEA